MDESEYNEEILMVCPFFLRSKCSKGDNCEFSHEINETQSILSKDVPCEFFFRGNCRFGKTCWYSHATPERKLSEEEENSGKIKMRYSFLHRPTPKSESEPSSCPRLFNLIEEMKESYAEVLKKTNRRVPEKKDEKFPMDMCIHYDTGNCPLEDMCFCLHGDHCEMCNKYCLHPTDRDERKKHREECEKEFMHDMELSFAIQCSQDKICGICLENVMEKEKPYQRKFGILEKCNHVFCLSCIREWRRRGKAVDLSDAESIVDQRVMRACPQCRMTSDFITPSPYWFESEEKKLSLISEYKAALKKKHCKYFKRGDGDCPFGGHCFYLHATPDGKIVELPPPTRRRRQNQNGEVGIFDEIVLFDYLEEREEGWQIIQYIEESDEHYLV